MGQKIKITCDKDTLGTVLSELIKFTTDFDIIYSNPTFHVETYLNETQQVLFNNQMTQIGLNSQSIL